MPSPSRMKREKGIKRNLKAMMTLLTTQVGRAKLFEKIVEEQSEVETDILCRRE